MINTKIVSRFLPVPLTTNEKVEFGIKLAHAHQEYSRVEVDKKSAADRFKDQLEEIDGLCSRLARIVRDGAETRDVECVWRYLFEANTKELVRMDTGEIVETASITADERQLMLQMEHEREAAEAQAQQP